METKIPLPNPEDARKLQTLLTQNASTIKNIHTPIPLPLSSKQRTELQGLS